MFVAMRMFHMEMVTSPDYVAWRRDNSAFLELAAMQFHGGNAAILGKAGAGRGPRHTGFLQFPHDAGSTAGDGPELRATRGTSERAQDRAAHRRAMAEAVSLAADIVGQNIALDGVTYQVIGVLPPSFILPMEVPTDILTPLPHLAHGKPSRPWSGDMDGDRAIAARCDAGAGVGERENAVCGKQGRCARNLSRRRFGNDRAAAASHGRECAHAGSGAGRRGGVSADDCLRERGEPAAGAMERAVGRAGGARGHRRGARQAGAPASDGDGGAGARRGPRWEWRSRRFGLRGVVYFAAGSLPRLNEVKADGRVFGIALAVSLLTMLLFGVLPALRAGRVDVQIVLQRTGRPGMSGGYRGARRALVAGEVALSVVLLSGAALLLETLWRVQHDHLGFVPEHVMSVSIPMRGAKKANRKSLTEEMLADIRKGARNHSRVLERMYAAHGRMGHFRLYPQRPAVAEALGPR